MVTRQHLPADYAPTFATRPPSSCRQNPILTPFRSRTSRLPPFIGVHLTHPDQQADAGIAASCLPSPSVGLYQNPWCLSPTRDLEHEGTLHSLRTMSKRVVLGIQRQSGVHLHRERNFVASFFAAIWALKEWVVSPVLGVGLQYVI
jgi:hypothetical protein